MLSTKALSDSLRLVLGDGVETALVVGISGDLLGAASTAPAGDAAFVSQNILSAAATNMWAAYANNDLSRPPQQAMDDAAATPEGLEMLFTTVGNSSVCLASVGGTSILCLAGPAGTVGDGMLKAKAATLQRHIDGPLRSLRTGIN